ncbi:MAG: DUF11 domain-containing protein [Anaerolineae bacterium]|nr:DUF11 domain-containing protein [Anaerolineae bacterium]
MAKIQGIIPPPGKKAASPHSHSYWVRFGIAGAAALGLIVLLLSSFAHIGRAATLMAPTISKSSVTSIEETNNTIGQAVAGEIVTVTVEFNVPTGETLYDVSPRVLLADGLYPLGSTPTWTAMYTGTTTALRAYEVLANRNGALVIFPTEGTVTGPATLTRVVRAVRTQYQYVGSSQIGNTSLRVQAVLRYCESSGCPSPLGLNDDSTNAQVATITPQVNSTYAMTYLDAGGVGAGGGQVQLTFIAANTSGRPTAHDIVYTATLGSGLTYNASSGGNGAGAGTVTSGPGGTTLIRWDVPVSLLYPSTWQAVVTATLPGPTLAIGSEFTAQGTATYETFDGAMDDEGVYTTPGASYVLRPGLSVVAKSSNPGSGAVTMGDMVDYTVVFRQGANTTLQAPQIVDTQPLGFHYIPESLVVQNATVASVTTSKGVAEGSGTAARYYENLTWVMSDLPSTAQTRVVTATYSVLNTGLDYDGAQVYYLVTDMRANKASISASKTGAVLSWTPPPGSTYSAATRANAGALGVIQPLMADNFSTARTDSGDREVGQFLNFTTKFRNNGYSTTGITAIPAYELEVCDDLPAGLSFLQYGGCFDWTGASCTFAATPPTPGDSGEICWTIPNLPKADTNSTHTYEFRYTVQVTDGAYPGAHTNHALIKTYSSQEGTVNGERIYSEFPNGLASAACTTNCPFTILGLAGAKTATPDVVAPGERITYTLAYSDTSALNNYTGLVMVDTYDSLLTFVSADPAPNSHNSSTRELTWNLGTLTADGSGAIEVIMEVSPVISGRYMLTNTMAFDSDQTSPRTWVKNTPIDVAALHVSMSGPATTYASNPVALTVVYSNTGSASSAPITLTLDYSPYLSYVSAAPLTPVAGTDNVFTTNVPNDGSNQTLTINLNTDAPLPYTLAEIVSSVELASPGAPSQNDAWTMVLDRPVFEFRKSGPSSAPNVGGTILYNFHVKNTGTLAATNLVITDTWDPATSFQSGVDWTSYGTYATYTIASLAPGDTATINPMNVQVTSASDSYLNQVALLTDQTSVQETQLRIWSPSLEVTKAAYPDPAFPGRVLTYTLTYTNVGGFTIGNAVITDTLPADFSYQGHTVNGAGCSTGWQFSHAGQIATWKCTQMDNTAAGQLQIWGLVADVEGSVLENMAESDGAPPIPRRPMETPLQTLVARPWLRVDKAGSPTHPVAPGDRITYTLTYENYGTYPAYDVVLKDTLPTQVTFHSCSDGCTFSGGVVTWDIGTVPTDTTGTVELYTSVKTGTGGQTAVNANYTIENTTVWQQLLPSETESGDPVNTTILNPQLTVTKAAAPSVVQAVNDTIVYTLTYQNTGGGFLHDVVIVDALDLYTAFASASTGCTHTGEAAGGTVTCELGDLANGESREVEIRVRVLAGLTAGDTITNQAQGDTAETTPANSNTTTVWYQVSGAGQISVAPTTLNYLVKVGASAFDVPVTVSNVSQVPLNWSVGENPSVSWLSQAPTNGSLNGGANATVTVTFNPAGLSPQDYTTTLVFSSGAGGNTVSVPVTLRVRAPQLAVAPTSFDYTIMVGTAAFTAPLRITNTGEIPVTWNLAEGTVADWLNQSALTGTLDPGAATTVTLSFNPAGLTLDTDYNTTLSLTGSASTISVPVKLRVASHRVYLPLTVRQYSP